MQCNLCMQAEVPQSVMQDQIIIIIVQIIVLSLQQVGPIITEPIAAKWAPSADFVLPRVLCREVCTVQYYGQSAAAAV